MPEAPDMLGGPLASDILSSIEDGIMQLKKYKRDQKIIQRLRKQGVVSQDRFPHLVVCFQTFE